MSDGVSEELPGKVFDGVPDALALEAQAANGSAEASDKAPELFKNLLLPVFIVSILN